jgi:hypothetical protein
MRTKALVAAVGMVVLVAWSEAIAEEVSTASALPSDRVGVELEVTPSDQASIFNCRAVLTDLNSGKILSQPSLSILAVSVPRTASGGGARQ